MLTVLLFFVIIHHVINRNGEMSEWFMELVLKTSDTERYRRFESYSLRHYFGDIPKLAEGAPLLRV